MTIDSDIARRVAIQHGISALVPQAEKLIDIAASPRMDDGRRRSVLGEAVGDLDAALVRAHGDLDMELTLIAAVCQAWLEDRAAALARCCCPLQDGVPSDERFVTPGCPAHDGGRS